MKKGSTSHLFPVLQRLSIALPAVLHSIDGDELRAVCQSPVVRNGQLEKASPFICVCVVIRANITSHRAEQQNRSQGLLGAIDGVNAFRNRLALWIGRNEQYRFVLFLKQSTATRINLSTYVCCSTFFPLSGAQKPRVRVGSIQRLFFGNVLALQPRVIYAGAIWANDLGLPRFPKVSSIPPSHEKSASSPSMSVSSLRLARFPGFTNESLITDSSRGCTEGKREKERKLVGIQNFVVQYVRWTSLRLGEAHPPRLSCHTTPEVRVDGTVRTCLV